VRQSLEPGHVPLSAPQVGGEQKDGRIDLHHLGTATADLTFKLGDVAFDAGSLGQKAGDYGCIFHTPYGRITAA
jgi:hypothetical protein